jgi:DNA modification methylase
MSTLAAPYESLLGRVHHAPWPAFTTYLPAGQVDLILADPPYFLKDKTTLKRQGRVLLTHDYPWDHFSSEEDYEQQVRAWLQAAVGVLAPHGSILWWTLVERVGFIKEQLTVLEMTHKAALLWCKTNPPPSFRKVNYRAAVEAIVWAVKGPGYRFHFGRQQEMLTYFMTPICQGKERWGHPTPKRVDVITRLLRVHSDPGNLVVDPFAGVGTVGVAAQALGRRYIGCESHPEYVRIANRRLAQTCLSHEQEALAPRPNRKAA